MPYFDVYTGDSDRLSRTRSGQWEHTADAAAEKWSRFDSLPADATVAVVSGSSIRLYRVKEVAQKQLVRF